MMSAPWTLILLYLTVLSSVIGYKLPFPDESLLSDPHSRTDYDSSSLMWERETDKSDKTLLTLIRKTRDILDKKKTQADAKYPLKTETVSKSPLDKSPLVNPKIVLPSKAPYTKPKIMAQLSEDETTALTEQNHISTEVKNLSETETQTDISLTAEIKTIATPKKFTNSQEQLSTPSPTESKDFSVFTKSSTSDEATTFGQLHSTDNKILSSIPDSTSNTMVEETASTVPSKIPNATPSTPMLTSTAPTIHGETTGWTTGSKGSSTTPVVETHISTTSEDKMLTQSLIKQCMLTILILAVVCTIFFVATIGLAAKLTTLRQKQKLRHPATYTEMRCISTLLPESDQQSKVKPGRLRTFGAMEESDGDNTTLNSFLPDH